ncbi:unnamed protein product, partial [Pleuronectes platessa]
PKTHAGCSSRGAPAALVTLDNLELIAGPRGGDVSFECLPYQLSMVLFVPTMVVHQDEGLPALGAAVGPLAAVGAQEMTQHDNLELIAGPRGGDVSFECLPYQLSMGVAHRGHIGLFVKTRSPAETRLSPLTKLPCHIWWLSPMIATLDLGIELTVRREASYRLSQPLPLGAPSMLLAECPAGSEAFTLKKLECSKQARSPEYRS